MGLVGDKLGGSKIKLDERFSVEGGPRISCEVGTEFVEVRT